MYEIPAPVQIDKHESGYIIYGYKAQHLQAAYEAGRASRDAEVEALRADALRYRFLQNGAYVGIAPHPKPHEVWCLRLPNPKDAANLDQAIDAAMSAQEKENG